MNEIDRVFIMEVLKMNITIRPIEKKDNQKIQKIIQDILEKYGLDLPGTAYFDPQLGELYDYYQKIPNGEYWVLIKENEVIGGVGIGSFGAYEEVAELQKYYIKEAYQGEGYGRLLYEQALHFTKEQGYSKLYLETSDLLGDANKIYQHLGFKALSAPLSGSEHELMNRWFIKSI